VSAFLGGTHPVLEVLGGARLSPGATGPLDVSLDDEAVTTTQRREVRGRATDAPDTCGQGKRLFAAPRNPVRAVHKVECCTVGPVLRPRIELNGGSAF